MIPHNLSSSDRGLSSARDLHHKQQIYTYDMANSPPISNAPRVLSNFGNSVAGIVVDIAFVVIIVDVRLGGYFNVISTMYEHIERYICS